MQLFMVVGKCSMSMLYHSFERIMATPQRRIRLIISDLVHRVELLAASSLPPQTSNRQRATALLRSTDIDSPSRYLTAPFAVYRAKSYRAGTIDV